MSTPLKFIIAHSNIDKKYLSKKHDFVNAYYKNTNEVCYTDGYIYLLYKFDGKESTDRILYFANKSIKMKIYQDVNGQTYWCYIIPVNHETSKWILFFNEMQTSSIQEKMDAIHYWKNDDEFLEDMLKNCQGERLKFKADDWMPEMSDPNLLNKEGLTITKKGNGA